MRFPHLVIDATHAQALAPTGDTVLPGDIQRPSPQQATLVALLADEDYLVAESAGLISAVPRQVVMDGPWTTREYKTRKSREKAFYSAVSSAKSWLEDAELGTWENVGAYIRIEWSEPFVWSGALDLGLHPAVSNLMRAMKESPIPTALTGCATPEQPPQEMKIVWANRSMMEFLLGFNCIGKTVYELYRYLLSWVTDPSNLKQAQANVFQAAPFADIHCLVPPRLDRAEIVHDPAWRPGASPEPGSQSYDLAAFVNYIYDHRGLRAGTLLQYAISTSVNGVSDPAAWYRNRVRRVWSALEDAVELPGEVQSITIKRDEILQLLEGVDSHDFIISSIWDTAIKDAGRKVQLDGGRSSCEELVFLPTGLGNPMEAG